jgi:hypothetical protein
VRHLRGNRPFRPLTVLVGMERAQELITKLRSGETSPMSQQQAEA